MKRFYFAVISATLKTLNINFLLLYFRYNIYSPVTSTDIFGYLVLDKSFCTKERFKAFKSLDSYIYFESGFVYVLGAKKFDTRVVTVGKVLSL